MIKKHRGKILENAIKLSGKTPEYVANEMGKTRRTMYNYYEKDDLSIDILLKIGKIISHDFAKELPELIASKNFVEEPRALYGNKEIKSEENWKKKYFDLLEEHNKTLRELNRFIRSEKSTSQKRPNKK